MVVCSVYGDGMATDEMDGKRCRWLAMDECSAKGDRDGRSTQSRSTIVTLGCCCWALVWPLRPKLPDSEAADST